MERPLCAGGVQVCAVRVGSNHVVGVLRQPRPDAQPDSAVSVRRVPRGSTSSTGGQRDRHLPCKDANRAQGTIQEGEVATDPNSLTIERQTNNLRSLFHQGIGPAILGADASRYSENVSNDAGSRVHRVAQRSLGMQE